MTSDGWRYAFASVVGASHQKSQLPCQDASECRVVPTPGGEVVLIAVASDGAGSAKKADEGSRFAAAHFSEVIETFLKSGNVLSSITQNAVCEWLDSFRVRIAAMAHAESLTPRDYACTLLAAMVGQDLAAFFQIGDGSIVINTVDDAEYQWVFWPARGEYENTTFFATDENSAQHLQFDVAPGRVTEVAIFTDGLQRLALHFGTNMAHAPFFRSLFPSVRNSSSGFGESLSESLASFLASARVNERTDDDKTLILASRMPSPSQV